MTDPGTIISTVGYNVASWYPITVPSTVMAGLVANNVYQNVFFGTNLQSVPDLTTQNWWYRGEFTAPPTALGQAYSDSIPVLLVAAGMPVRHPGLGKPSAVKRRTSRRPAHPPP